MFPKAQLETALDPERTHVMIQCSGGLLNFATNLSLILPRCSSDVGNNRARVSVNRFMAHNFTKLITTVYVSLCTSVREFHVLQVIGHSVLIYTAYLLHF